MHNKWNIHIGILEINRERTVTLINKILCLFDSTLLEIGMWM